MGLNIITADERLKSQRGIKGVISGPSGIGKTSLLWTLNPDKTLFINMEAGELSVQGWAGDMILVRTWADARDLACFVGGPNPALRDDQVYSQAHYNAVCENYGEASLLDKYDTIFVDSITVASRLCMQWSKGQPQAFSDKTGKPDVRGAYGLLGQEMIGWLTHLQHTPEKNVWLVGILDEKMDDFNRRYHTLQVEGSKTGLELPGIVDEVISMVSIPDEDGNPQRAFVCQTLNQWDYPAKDRSGRLNMVEEPHLGRLMDKIRMPAKPAPERLSFAEPHIPGTGPATPTETETETEGATS